MLTMDILFRSFCSKSRSINFQFPQKQGTGIRKLLPHVSTECLELIELMCTYDPDER
jgi:renal tumor antigen